MTMVSPEKHKHNSAVHVRVVRVSFTHAGCEPQLGSIREILKEAQEQNFLTLQNAAWKSGERGPIVFL